MMTPREIVLETLKRMQAGEFHRISELYADDFVLRAPFAHPAPIEIRGKQQHAAMLKAIEENGAATRPRMYEHLEVRDLRVHETTDPNVAIMEWVYVSRIGDETVETANIVVTECRDGKVVRTTDYHDHVMRAVADGTVPAYLEVLDGMILEQDR